MLSYSYTLTPDDNGTLLVQFPDIPEAAPVSEDEENARYEGRHGLEAALQIYIDARRPIPIPASIVHPCISLSALEAAKVLLSNEMVRQGIRSWLAGWMCTCPRSTGC